MQTKLFLNVYSGLKQKHFYRPLLVDYHNGHKPLPLYYFKHAWAVLDFDWLFDPRKWDTTSWMLFLISLALYDIMKMKVVIFIH